MILIQKTSDLLRGGGNVYYSAFYSAFLLSNTGRAKHNAATLLMDAYCVLAGKVAGGGAGCLTAVTGFELARETRFPTQVPKKIASPVSGVPTTPVSRAAVTIVIYCIKSTAFGDACSVWERPDTCNGC